MYQSSNSNGGLVPRVQLINPLASHALDLSSRITAADVPNYLGRRRGECSANRSNWKNKPDEWRAKVKGKREKKKEEKEEKERKRDERAVASRRRIHPVQLGPMERRSVGGGTKKKKRKNERKRGREEAKISSDYRAL